MKTAFLYLYIPELSTFEYDYLMGLHIKEGKRQKQEMGGGGGEGGGGY